MQIRNVYELHEALYGLKNAPRAWNKRIGKIFVQPVRNAVLSMMYISNTRKKETCCSYVDDLLVASSNKADK
jgi:hypothetical protein